MRLIELKEKQLTLITVINEYKEAILKNEIRKLSLKGQQEIQEKKLTEVEREITKLLNDERI